MCGTLGGFLALAGPVRHVVTTVTATDGLCLCVFCCSRWPSGGLGFLRGFDAAKMAPTGGDYRHCERWVSSWGGFGLLPFAFAVFLSFFGSVFFLGGWFFLLSRMAGALPFACFLARVILVRFLFVFFLLPLLIWLRFLPTSHPFSCLFPYIRAVLRYSDLVILFFCPTIFNVGVNAMTRTG